MASNSLSLYATADREHEDSKEFRAFWRQLFHTSMTFILQSLRLGMSKPEVLHYGDGHYRRTIFGLVPHIADYPEQVLIACVVQDWCPKCMANPNNLDGERSRHSHAHMRAAMVAFDEKTLWYDYGIVSGIMVCSSGHLTKIYLSN